ncbi:(E)-4-hydroxy-3-methylbut-2-enyl-diphosphate synthase [Treponema pallidum]|uniref:4-hydroxy-3-methylbut-2-en-1-yl diphosphate synthase (flavodoxin) n=2 Tax=Treponema pallidum subsp. pallidum TaxID=161 RepID=ISPG_TREPA|nr:(E)-4-hydroxy-3-methylbut-2-enyl-diphosphate synthase [Treponema pallidum]O83460.1 RecName: Full=4-hydroxy-3-methylbut-2-en-1-yl diphosphate synthase (flavodoxin); AltName: Full=1-hydroxy-2-methyl-2-(E)-butenyl 4-diphosphate synthase [Treponema pallidum subsp. pallidum str. Nichols]AAC65433.1 gcpE protein (gcpE) [Treponema pallidum subsp. pallidum str. Nichols]ACD70871.1 4-hydroxy-3-methylbut-2-en-1-yl diphosphate synthase [Treponema pallidum subsp. pallidum SS14]AFU66450.1 (E)-4-hydroxy-3-m
MDSSAGVSPCNSPYGSGLLDVPLKLRPRASHYRARSLVIGGKEHVRALPLGGDAPIPIQTMWKEPLIGADLQSIVDRLLELEQLGCDVVRFAVPDRESAELFVALCARTRMPLVADIHFDYRLALRCMDGPVAKVRINPGNIGVRERVRAVVEKARATGTALRIGVNTGSLPGVVKRAVAARYADGMQSVNARAEALVQTAFAEAAYLDQLHFDRVVLSLKASTVAETVRANELFAQQSDIPLHLGVTEAGPLVSGIVKSTLAFSQLLSRNIGATVRVSLSDSMEHEVLAAREILAECGKRAGGVRLVSCPRCGRIGFDVHAFVRRWQKELFSLKKDITVAVMGCVVNGPGEGKHADLGISGAEDSVIFFKRGKIVRRIQVRDLCADERTRIIDAAFKEELSSL